MNNFSNPNIFTGKHIAIRAPPKSGTQFYNYKKHFSIVLLGICDTKYKFLYFNVGAYGSESDGGIFRNSAIGEAFENGAIPLPNPRAVNGSNFPLPYFLVGDAAFPLKKYLMTPYSGRNLPSDKIFHNQELSKGRCFIENSFGILAARWRVFSGPLSVHPQNADTIVLATVMLHNLLVSEPEQSRYISANYLDRYVDGNRIDGQWRAEARGSRLEDIPTNLRLGARNATSQAIEIRNNIKEIIYNNHINRELR